MKKLLFLSSAAIFFNACGFINCTEGEGKIISKTFSQEEFSKFSMSISGDIELIPSDKNSIEITTYENIFEKLEIENRSDELEVDVKGCVRLDRETKVRLFFTRLSEVNVEGSGNVISRGVIRSDKFEINIQGSGDANIEVETSSLEAGIMGSGDILLKGKAEELEISINGSGNVKATDLQCNKTRVDINGSGDAQLGNCDNLKTNINGSGNVDCSGKK
jgi:hypothetical protein